MVSQSANMAAASGRVGGRLPSNKWFQAEDIPTYLVCFSWVTFIPNTRYTINIRVDPIYA